VYGYFLGLTPAPLPFSAMNSTPAAFEGTTDCSQVIGVRYALAMCGGIGGAATARSDHERGMAAMA
jgi:hypothetical protein